MARVHEKHVVDTKQIVADVLKYFFLTLGALVLFFPFLWMLTTSLKTLSEAIATPPVWLPRMPQWSNYATVWNMRPFMRYILNTVIAGRFGGSCQSEELGLPVTQSGLPLPCGAAGRWMR